MHKSLISKNSLSINISLDYDTIGSAFFSSAVNIELIKSIDRI